MLPCHYGAIDAIAAKDAAASPPLLRLRRAMPSLRHTRAQRAQMLLPP